MKKVLITGASGSLGSACVHEFINQGYHVIGTVSPGKQLDYSTKADVSVYPVNLADEAETDHTFNQIITDHQQIDAALLLVGGFSMGTLQDTDGDSLRKMLSLNFETAYHISRRVFAKMTEQPGGGRIVMVGAKPALDPKAAKSKVAYSLSKSLIFRLAEILNEEGKAKNVVSTVVVPSIIDTKPNRKSMPKADPADWVTAEQIASIMAFVTSDNGSALREPVLKIYGNS